MSICGCLLHLGFRIERLLLVLEIIFEVHIKVDDCLKRKAVERKVWAAVVRSSLVFRIKHRTAVLRSCS